MIAVATLRCSNAVHLYRRSIFGRGSARPMTPLIPLFDYCAIQIAMRRHLWRATPHRLPTLTPLLSASCAATAHTSAVIKSP